jgi:peptide methionine sulfoxide reductase MsrB
MGATLRLQPLLFTLMTGPAVVVTAPRASALPKCDGPVQPELLFGCTQDHAMAEQICCRNRHYAEPSGYQEQSHINLFPKLKAGLQQDSTDDGVTTFYDSVCGKPLFRAPVGRSFEEWQAESLEHGWPSFRDVEVVKENIVVDKSDGEVRSICGLHLGHNIPDKKGDRYCIDLVCIAGKPETEMVHSRGLGEL